MAYDPFARGSLPVGVRTFQWTDPARRDRALTVETWYPATDAHRGQDLAAATRDHYELIPGFPPGWQEAVRDAAPRAGCFPLVVFSHGFGAHRRQSTFLCTHLASHGYVVAAMDHTGNTIVETVQIMMAAQMGMAPPPDPVAILAEIIPARPVDVSFVIDRLLAGAAAGLPGIDAERIGMSGHSFGGWTTLMVVARDRRVRAALPLAPAGGWSPLPSQPLGEALDFAWGRDVPTLFLVADSDTILPLHGMYDLLARTRSTKRMVVLRNTDHMHFCDRAAQAHEMFRAFPPPGFFEDAARTTAPFTELSPETPAYDAIRALGLAHLDAALKEHAPAAAFMRGDLPARLGARGIEVVVH